MKVRQLKEGGRGEGRIREAMECSMFQYLGRLPCFTSGRKGRGAEVGRREIQVLSGGKYKCWQEVNTSVDRREILVFTGGKHKCWQEGNTSVDRREIQVLTGGKYKC